MPIDFRITSVEVKTFRGLKVLELALPQRAPVVLIGANNSCKSTLLDALSFALAGPSFYNYVPSKFDFFHDASQEAAASFEVTVQFDANNDFALPAVRGGIGDPVPVHGAKVTGSADRRGRYSHEVRLIDKAGDPILLSSGVPLKGSAKEAWKDHGLSFSRRYARWSDINEHRPDVWLLRPGNLFVSLYQWKTGPLHRLAKLLASRFFGASWDFEYDNKKRPMPGSLQSLHRFLVAAVQNFPFWRDDLKPKLESTISAYVGHQACMDLNPKVEAIEEWLAEQLALSFSADAGGATTPLERMGDGWQSIVRIAALDVLSQYPEEKSSRVVLLFEEPESFLHPHLSRKLRGVLERLADAGWTVALTTHSPNLVSFSSRQFIVRLTRLGEDVSARHLDTASVDGASKFQERLDERGTHEMLFAQRIVLCEGQDDVFAVRSYLVGRCSIDLDGRSVSIIRAGDVGQLPALAGMATKLGIPWCAVSDEDRQSNGIIKPATEDPRERLTALQSSTDCQVQWKGNLEACLRKDKGKAEPSWQAREIESKALDEIVRDYPDYHATCENIRRWVMQ